MELFNENTKQVKTISCEEVDGKMEDVETSYEYVKPDGYMAFTPEEVADGHFKTFTDMLDKMQMAYVVKSDGYCRLVWYFEDMDNLDFIGVREDW